MPVSSTFFHRRPQPSASSMVKFSKELEAQLIPEWQHAFVNYRLLKKQVKKIKLLTEAKCAPDSNQGFGRSVFDSLQLLRDRITRRSSNGVDNSSEIVEQVKNRATNEGENGDGEGGGGGGEGYEPELVQLSSEEDEVKVFFELLNHELNKVNQFYTTKESEVLERGEISNKQLQVLLDLKKANGDRRQKKAGGSGISPLLSRSDSSGGGSSDFSESPGVKSCNTPPSHSRTDEARTVLKKNCLNLVNSAGTKEGNPKMAMRFGIPANTPPPTPPIASVASFLWEDLVSSTGKGGAECINRKRMERAEKMIRGAFVELYKGLGLLKTYCSLNMVAFTKILKKFDKVTNHQASVNYLKVVKRSHFISSDKVVRLMDEVESLFTKHFANNDTKKAMKFLKPQHQNASDMITFFVGLFTGSFVTLFVVYGFWARISGMFSPDYMEMLYPIFSMFALLSLHLFMYGFNLFAWKSTRINYTFIFDFHPGTALKYQDAFLICTCLMTFVVAAMIIHLILLSVGFASHQIDFILGILSLSFLMLLICPLNFFYRSTRYSFLCIMRNIVFSPFYKVLMVDFFMADQLTSQVPLLRHMESVTCYFLTGSFHTQQYATCKFGKLYKELAYIISFAPYYWRGMQCIRRWYDECNAEHLANLGKYVSAMVAAGARLTYSRHPSSQVWMVIVLLTSIEATVYQLYWDFVKDWGLLNPKSRNPWLRDDLILKNKYIYYGSIALNFVLRVAWVETMMKFNIGMSESRFINFLLASLEVIRRGIWNYFRLEHEHLNNVRKCRAVKSTPLPFLESNPMTEITLEPL